jgi:shikimate dehydrogenase
MVFIRKMEIIRATQENIPDIIFLNSFVQRIHRDQHPDRFRAPDDVKRDAFEFFDAILRKEENRVLVAYKDKEPVGYVWVTIDVIPENPFKNARKQMYIHQIIVHSDYRRQSIGTALFSEAENIAKLDGIKHFELDSWVFNTEAHEFFKRLGFETFNIRMWRDT